MNDLKERLRNRAFPQGTYCDFRDGRYQDVPVMGDSTAAEALAEIERLESDLSAATQEHNAETRLSDRLVADIKRLSADRNDVLAQRDAAVAENARLREKLRPFAEAKDRYGRVWRQFPRDRGVAELMVGADAWRALAAEFEEKDNG